MDRIMEWLVKVLFIAMLAPFLLCLLLEVALGLALAILPWVLLGSVLAGLAAGVSAALVLRHRLPPPRRTPVESGGMPAGQQRIRRPKGPRGLEEE